ncbi:16835_t:CDS:2 [Funneliformis mosseae]|uniref:16835_t:CDS:1 n=1 Tax=Funneliformis mosseae TaxID=27381 RepID=A0A9N9EV50_FUNMO|nr:16835_t:CDS:2 [Funneliformis mosseae]
MKKKLEESISYIRSLPPDKILLKVLNTLADRAEKALNAWKNYERKIVYFSQIQNSWVL